MTELILKGCTYEPMSSYLSALAVLRLVSEQKDPNAKGWWDDLGVFHLDSCLDEDRLINFFLDEYRPTPIVSPWNGGSGFYDGDNVDNINAIMNDGSVRFDTYRNTIKAIRSFPEIPNTDIPVRELLVFLSNETSVMKGKKRDELLELIQDTEKLALNAHSISPDIDFLNNTIEELEQLSKVSKISTESEKSRSTSVKSLIKEAKKVRSYVKQMQKKKGTGKEDIISACRDRLEDQAIEWIDASTILTPDGKAAYPPVLGTGGNDGRFEFSNNFMGCLRSMLLDTTDFSKDLISNAIFDKKTESLQKISIGQYDPTRTGGFNQGNGIENKDEFKANPWTFILTFEGAILWASSVVKSKNMRLKESHLIRSPFTVRSVQVGYNSSSEGENSRAEIWAPLWKNPTDYNELKLFFSEGRANIGKDAATNSIEFAQAATSLGVDRGISGFIRYNLLERRGKSYLALPAGIINVLYKEESDLIREINRPLSQIDSALRGDNIPASFKSARRKIDEKIYETLQNGGRNHVKSLVSAIGEFEKLVSRSAERNDPIIKKPISSLSPRWINFADDGSLEVRIAAAVASIARSDKVGSIRANISHTDPENPYQWDNGRGQFAWEGNSIYARLSSVLSRRMMDADRLGVKTTPLWGAIRITEEDISAFIEGHIDESLLENLIYGFSWINWNKNDEVDELRRSLFDEHGGWNKPVQRCIISRPYALLKLLFLPDGIKKGNEKIILKPETSIIPLLCANRINDACKIAERRLITKDFIPVTSSFPDGGNGVRLSAALLIPLRNEREIKRLVLKRETD